MYRKKFLNKDIGVQKQEESHTTEEAVRNLEKSCKMCKFQAMCNEKICPVYQAHVIALERIYGEQNAYKVNVYEHITRDYKITPTGAAKRALAYFIKRVDVPNWQVAKSTQFLKNIEERNFGDLEQNLLGVAGTRGRLPAGEWGEILKLIRAVLKAAKEV